MSETNPDRNADDFADTATRSAEAGIADETAAYDQAMTPTEGGDAAEESEAQPS